MNTKEFLAQDWVKQEIISRLNYNPETGSLTWASRDCKSFDSTKVGSEVGYIFVKDGYTNCALHIQIRSRKINIVVARLCWLVQTGDWPKHTIDHVDRNSLNNKWENLRDVTQEVNNSNKGLYRTKYFGGISKNEGGFQLRLRGEYLGRSSCFGKVVKLRQQNLKNHLTLP